MVKVITIDEVLKLVEIEGSIEKGKRNNASRYYKNLKQYQEILQSLDIREVDSFRFKLSYKLNKDVIKDVCAITQSE